MPYLTLWDKIWQNFALRECTSHKKIQISQNFQIIYKRFYEEININHTQLWFSQASYMKKDFRLYWGSSKVMFKKISQNFVNSPLKFCLISQILVHNLCMYVHVLLYLPKIVRRFTPYHICPKIWTTLFYSLLMCVNTAKWVTNNVDHFQTPHSVASDLSLHRLLGYCPSKYSDSLTFYLTCLNIG